MVAGVIGTVFGVALTVGLVTLVVFLTARRKAKKAGPQARVEFNPRGLRGVLLFIGALAVLVWVAVLMAVDSDRPSWVFSVGIVFFLGVLRPVLQKIAGSMFVVSREGKSTGGADASPAGYYNPAQFPPAQPSPALYPPTHFMTRETASAQYGAPASAPTAATSGGGTPEAAAHTAATKKPLTRRQADLRLLYLPASASVMVALVLGFGGNWTAAGFLMGLAVITALSYVIYRNSVVGRTDAKAAEAAHRGEETPG